jgi:hypothetical protein
MIKWYLAVRITHNQHKMWKQRKWNHTLVISSLSSLNAIVSYTYGNRFKYYWTVVTLHKLRTAPFLNTKPYLEHEMSVCRTQTKAPIQPNTVSNSVIRPTVFIFRTPWNCECSWILTTLLVKRSKLSWRHSHRFCFSLVSEWRSHFVFWQKMLASYTAIRRVKTVKYFHNYNSTYAIVPELLVLSLLCTNKYLFQSDLRAKIFFFCTNGHVMQYGPYLNEPQVGNITRLCIDHRSYILTV